MRKALFTICSILFFAGASAQKNDKPLDIKLAPGFIQVPAHSNCVNPTGVDVDSKGNIYIAHHGAEKIMVFDPDGKYQGSLAQGMLTTPHGLRIDKYDNIWITDLDQHVVFKLDNAGILQMVLGQRNTPGEYNEELQMALFNRPADIAFGRDDEIYIADGYGNSRIVKFDKNGKFIYAWGTKGTENGQFDNPHNIITDTEGKVYVADRNNLRVQVFDANGKHLESWAHLGKPWGLSITNDQVIYLCEGTHGQIFKLDTKGKVLGEYSSHGKGPGQLMGAHGICVDSQGNLYVTEVFNWRVQKFKL